MTTDSPPTFGPGELYVIAFPQERVPGSVWAAVLDAVADGAVTLLDLMVVRRLADGGLEIVEVDDPAELGLSDELGLSVVDIPASGLVGEDDLADVAAELEPGTSALVVLLEHTWARAVAAAVREADAVVVATERIPADVMNEIGSLATT